MMIEKKIVILFCGFLLFLSTFSRIGGLKQSYLQPSMMYKNVPEIFLENPIIHNIFIVGLENIHIQAVLAKLTVKIGDILDRKKIASLVKNIFALGYFSDVTLYYSTVLETNDGKEKAINLHIKVKEKKKLANFRFEGNAHISQETFEKKINISKISWIDEASILVIIEKIKKIYAEKQYYKANITYVMEYLDTGSVNVFFKIDEGVFGRVRKINFKGNNSISRSELKDILVSREAWLLGFLDRGGVYRKEMIDYDRFQIENYYHNKGFYEAQVLNVKLEENETDGMIDVTFYIEEGQRFNFNLISYENNSLLTEEQLKKIVRINAGDLYDKDKIKNAIAGIKSELGDKGYMYSSVNPKIKIDKKNNLIDIVFLIDKGKPVYVKSINILGNIKTYEDVVRRELFFNEGDILTVKNLEKSKRALEGLGFFQQGTGVDWQLNSYDKYQVDVNWLLQEAKTGRVYLNLSINSGSDAGQNLQGLAQEQANRWYNTLLTVSRIGLTLRDSHWNGKAVGYFLDASYASTDRSFSCGMSTPWLFNYPISAGWNATFRNLIYNDFKQSTSAPNEKNQGVNIQFGYRCGPLNNVIFGMSLGMDNIAYVNQVIPLMRFPDNPIYQAAYSQMVLRSFQPGTITWINMAISDDKRNHPTRATVGYKWLIEAKVALPNQNLFKNVSNFGYTRIGIEGSWYTPLISEYDVILYLHGYGGYIYQFKDCNIPYKELFHIGGPQNVRGFLYGQIGPMLMGSSLGATKAFFFNAEIRCPITKVNGMMVLAFYDGGAGWDTIYYDPSSNQVPCHDMQNLDYFFAYNPNQVLIKNNNPNYRHAVGVGIRLTQPMPVKIDWGIKLDRNKRLGESLSEVHISMEGEY